MTEKLQEVIDPQVLVEACPRTFNNTIEAVAEVTLVPDIQVTRVRSECIGEPVISSAPFPNLAQACSFIVAQEICTETDLSFGADVDITRSGVICGRVGEGECSEPPVASCTYSHGYFKNHPNIRNFLLDQVGGSIVLGRNDEGLTIVATKENAEAILDHNPPAPAPTIPPYKNQYAILYAQLLAANLNIIQGAVCQFAQDSINNANNFIATSNRGGSSGAPNFQSPLDLYNRGLAEGCPKHCE